MLMDPFGLSARRLLMLKAVYDGQVSVGAKCPDTV